MVVTNEEVWRKKMENVLMGKLPFEHYMKIVLCIWRSMGPKGQKKFFMNEVYEFAKMLTKESHINSFEQLERCSKECIEKVFCRNGLKIMCFYNVIPMFKKAVKDKSKRTLDRFLKYLAYAVYRYYCPGSSDYSLCHSLVGIPVREPKIESALDDYLFIKLLEVADSILSNEKNIELINEINAEIDKLRSYGLRTELVEKIPSCLLIWYNAYEQWSAANWNYTKKQEVELDANMLIVPYPREVVRKVQCFLKPLPLFVYSLEYKKRYIPPEEWEAHSRAWAKKQFEKLLNELHRELFR